MKALLYIETIPSCHKEALPIIQAKHKATRALTKIKVEEKVSRVQPRPK